MSVKLTRRALVSLLPVVGLVACGGSSETAGSASAAASGEAAAGVRTDAGYQLNAVTDGAPTVTLYTDLQCPYCAKADPKYREAAAELEGTMNMTVRHFPLSMHANAVPAAQAVQAAEAQGAYVAMADHLYTHQADWKEITDTAQFATLMGDYAEALGLDRARFESDLPSEEALALIEQEYQDGVAAGVKGTPSFVVEGTKLENVDSATSTADMVAAFKQAAGL
ncbi:disulfide bond formation protein DsbA [Rothia nasimurium]|uniref:Disulfide bond formation protein DsbA n=1 Tax=Rothia nasimurium TaxID=85336 RepID=A0A4Y9F238_9MICC|nr:thioredoxin domain-containing protein [Rothia nasimurium]MBF0808719.1 thioredoxin domain-containing protein [Rothia nasimurium]TFU21529.1 disulfide bond formation protein DsbA [Rothia nasimurium]